MTKKKNQVQYDLIFLELVPRIVDTNPQLFKDNGKYWNHAVEQVYQFLGRLADNYKGDISEERFEEQKGSVFTCDGSPYELRIGFRGRYNLIILPPDLGYDRRQAFTNIDYIACPLFNVVFKPTNRDGARRIIQAGLDQFFLLQGDIDKRTLAAVGFKEREVADTGLELLAGFLPRETVVEARCNYQMGNRCETYRL